MKTVLLILAAVVISAAVLLLVKTSRGGYESAAYEVTEKDGVFEVRDYEAHTLVSTVMQTGDKSDRDGGFNRLFRYISGKNEVEQKIAMTTPVFIDQPDETQRIMSFVIPADVDAPDAASEAVTIEKIGPKTYAARRFKGSSRAEKKVQSARESLVNWVTEQGLEMSGPIREAYYDPPWTPPFLRRNEVLVPVKR